MNIFLWILQAVLAFHTGAGAAWKFSNAEQTVPSLSGIPHSVWLAMAGLEILCAICLVVPAFNKSIGWIVPLAALFIVAEMLVFCGVSLLSGTAVMSEIGYWLVVAALSAFVAYTRFESQPIF